MRINPNLLDSCTLDRTSIDSLKKQRAPMKSYALTQDGIHCKCKYPVIWSISPSAVHLQTSDRYRRKHEEHVLRMGTQRNAKIHNLRSAVEGGDGVAIVLGVLQKLEEVVSGDNSGRDVAGSDHGCSCWIWCVSNWRKNYGKSFFCSAAAKSESTTWRRTRL